MGEKKDEEKQRLSVLLDSDEMDLIEELQSELHSSKAGVLREGLRYLRALKEEKIPPSELNSLLDYIEGKDHVLLDIEFWRSFFKEVEDYPENFWKTVEKIGREEGKRYRDKGLHSVEEVLEYIETANWYNLTKESEDVYTLILQVEETEDFVIKVLESIFDPYPQKIEMEPNFGRVRVRVLKKEGGSS
ncbi:MAG: hypothetical protein ABEJ72_04770 [Candidatus Aenigmatarchaeota archaeon]